MNLRNRNIGDLWILSFLERNGPQEAASWWHHHLPALREAGLVRPALRLHRGWELTKKGRAGLLPHREALQAEGRG